MYLSLLGAWLRFVLFWNDPFLRDAGQITSASTSGKHTVGIATIYGMRGDKYGRQPLACAPQTRVDNTMHVCAHRKYKCGTILIVENPKTKRRTYCRVMDRGPWGAIVLDEVGNKTWVIKIKKSDPGEWRGILDMTPAVGRAIGHTGYGRVKTWVVHVPAKKIIVKSNKFKKSRQKKQDKPTS